ncbi:GNAT family N-acetyltransferase [Conexibacter sp. SYSU D00693]|uniref:GNAT family N-acetyltransferase n=1 Tax=Conexibacter sp. SYSU D00693 TaxID=2812560 RepID=UPI00196A7266|nr:GNAT family N-acetyltransferase [Conexibacter sp. SYSU D00693]
MRGEPSRLVALRDGSVALVRDVVPDDERGLDELFRAGMGVEARQRRFFSAAVATAAMARAAALHAADEVGLVVEQDGRLIAHAMAVPLDGEDAEVAFAVADDRHGLGLATLLLGSLARRMDAAGVRRLHADVLPGNQAMLEVFEHAAPADEQTARGCVHVTLDVDEVLAGLAGQAAVVA